MSWSGFHRLSRADRLHRLAEHASLDDDQVAALDRGLPAEDAAAFVENFVGRFDVPLGVAVGFLIDGEDVVVPMAVEESSVVAAASHGAKLARAGGGFETISPQPITIGQVELRDVAHARVEAALEEHKTDWMLALDDLIPSMVARGGGVRDLVLRSVGDRSVVHIHLDCRDAMGANAVNTLAEGLAPWVAEATGARIGLRILTNLATQRITQASCRVPVEALGGDEVARAIVEANGFAQLDPFRAATHNKGIMNGMDPVCIATGNDWRALEAGAHAFAAQGGTYTALTEYRVDGDELVASIEVPIQVGTIGGVTRLHPSARSCLRLLGDPDAPRLSAIMAAVGLAQNLSALKALATEGIQRGHMSLHARNVARQAGLQGALADKVAAKMAEAGTVSMRAAQEWASKLGP